MLDGFVQHQHQEGAEGWGAVFNYLWSLPHQATTFFSELVAPSKEYVTHNIVSTNDLNPSKKRLIKIAVDAKENTNHQSSHFSIRKDQETQFEQFRARLKANKNILEVPYFMEGIIDALDLQLIIDKVLNYIARHRNFIENLKANQAIRFNKHTHKLPFNAQITRSNNGKYRLFVETNTRMKDGTKNKENALLGEGTSKKVLKCYRIDLPRPEIWACSKVKSDIQDTVNEARLMNDLNHPYIPKMDIGHIYKRNSKIVLYSKLAIGTLEDIIKGKIPASEEEKRTLILQILRAVGYFNSKGIVHQDLKPINILIYRAKDNSLRAKVNDFGLAHTPTNGEERGGTIGYEPPETSAYHISESAVLHDYFHKNSKPSLAKSVLINMQVVPDVEQYPDLKSDSWAMGVILYEMFYGIKPDFATLHTQSGSGNKIIDRLLEINPTKRITCSEALNLLRAQYEEENEPRITKKRKSLI